MRSYVINIYKNGIDHKTTRALVPVATALGYTQKIDDFVTVDFNYTYDTNWNNYDLKLSAGLKNAFDEEPPLVWEGVNFSYDPKHHDARGRMVYVGFKLATN